MSSGTGSRITRLYGGFRGVDFRGKGEVNHLGRSPDCLNVWKDYRETDSIRTRPGMTRVRMLDENGDIDEDWDVDGPVYGIHPLGKLSGLYGENHMLAHIGTMLYLVITDDNGISLHRLYLNAKAAPSRSFLYDNTLYLMDGERYMRTVNDILLEDVTGYVPTTSIARNPAGGGTLYQDVNMLSDYRINTFLADGVSTEYYLDARNIDEDFVPEVICNEVKVLPSSYDVDYTEGKITFHTFAPGKPLTDGQDNVSVKFKKHVAGYRESILHCTLLQVFDNRVFVSGNPDHPNVVWHCSLNDPSYFSDTDFYREGMDNAQVKGMVAGNNALWVFREPSGANTNVFYHTPTLDEQYGKIYPSSHSSVTTGCIGKAINFNDDIVFFSERGMEGISGDITTEQMVAHRSSLVDRKLIGEAGYKDMVLAEWEGYLLVFIGSHVYLADSRTAFTLDDHIEYEWFYWELEKKVTCAEVVKGVLYIGTEDGELYTLTDVNACVESCWTTPKDRFGYPHMQKTTNKKGCVAEATGDLAVYAKTESTNFELIGTYENVTDYFVSRIKRKKFKDIQLKFHSSTRFSLESVSLEVFVGAYIKR